MDIASSVIQVISFLFLIQIQIYNTYMLLVHAGQTGYAGAYPAYPVPLALVVRAEQNFTVTGPVAAYRFICILSIGSSMSIWECL